MIALRRRRVHLQVALACLLAATILAAGCGGGAPDATRTAPAPHATAGGSVEFSGRGGGDRSVQEFGRKAEGPELRAAAAALHGFLDARAKRSWAVACTYLARTVKGSFRGGAAASVAGRSCAAALVALSGEVPTPTLREAARVRVHALRIEGDQAFLIYRGAPAGTAYAIPMAREAGRWKVAALAGLPLS